MPNIQFPSSYSFAKRFVSASITTVGGSNGVTAFDDPTYLGFTLVFDRTSPLFNGADKGETEPANSQLGSQQSPTQGGGQVNINLPDSPPQGGQSKTIPSGESAVAYLEKIGENTRATYLRAFIQGLLEINDTRPYYWQTIEGLTEAWSAMSEINDPYTGTEIGGNEGIAIGCLEAIDLKISALFTLYKIAVYDNKYKRYILPRNLMNFDVAVYVSEIRKFNTLLDENREIKIGKFVNQNVSQIGFKFTMCNWIPADCGKVFESVTNAGGNTFASTSIKWAYSNIHLDSQFSGYSSSLDENRKQTTSQISTGNPTLGSKLFPKNPVVTDAKFVDQLKQILNDQTDVIRNNLNRLSSRENLGNTFSGELNRLQNTVLQRISLGNIFGIRNELLQNIQNPQLLQNAVNGAAFQVAEELRNRNRRGPSLGGNPLGDGVQPSRTLPNERLFSNPSSGSNLGTSNIFGTGPSGPSPLESTNVFG